MLTFIDWFAGIGGFRRGMELAGHRCIGFCEFDKYAVASYVSMHCLTAEQREKLSKLSLKRRQKEILKDEYKNGEWFSPDVTRTDSRDIPVADVWCFGFPCQDISVAGKQVGFEGNRSSLFFGITGLLREIESARRPHYLLIENVKNLLSVNHGLDFGRLLIELADCGYTDVRWQLLNSKYFGVPQNRERVFIVASLGGKCGRAILPFGGDDEEADPEIGSSQEGEVKIVGNRNPSGNGINGQVYDSKGLAPTLTTNKGEGPSVLLPDRQVSQIGSMGGGKYEENGSQAYRVYDSGGLAPTLGTMQGGGREPHICVDGPVNDTEKSGVAIPVLTPDREEKRQNGRGFKENGEPMFTLTAQDRRGVMIEADPSESDLKILNRGEECESKRVYDPSGIVATIAARDYKDAKKVAIPQEVDCININDENGKERPQQERVYSEDGVMTALNAQLGGRHNVATSYRIRKLTPKECFRLQGWTDDYFEKAQFVNSDSQLYKQAGNGVTVNVIQAIAERFPKDVDNTH